MLTTDIQDYRNLLSLAGHVALAVGADPGPATLSR